MNHTTQHADAQFGYFTDRRDNYTYKTICYGETEWFAENFRYTSKSGRLHWLRRRDSWEYDDDPANVSTYGRLYSWDNAVRLVPVGWRLPTIDDYKALAKIANSEFSALVSMGFSSREMLSAGNRTEDGKYYAKDVCSDFWSITERSEILIGMGKEKGGNKSTTKKWDAAHTFWCHVGRDQASINDWQTSSKLNCNPVRYVRTILAGFVTQ